jgi:hypothetical protein
LEVWAKAEVFGTINAAPLTKARFAASGGENDRLTDYP